MPKNKGLTQSTTDSILARLEALRHRSRLDAYSSGLDAQEGSRFSMKYFEQKSLDFIKAYDDEKYNENNGGDGM